MTETDVATGRRRSPVPLIAVVLILALAAFAAFRGISTRARTLVAITQDTQELAVPTVAVTAATRGAPQEEISLPGTIQPFAEAPIYARTNGYLKRWTADIGAHVAAGQLLAEVDTPEISQQLQQARADLATAEANSRLAQSTADRYRELIKTDSISQQDLDNANGALEARQAAVESARFNVKRLEEMQGFSRIDAPFAGVVTARNVDVGALIGTGSGKELFHVAATDRLRVFVNVPQLYSQAAKPGLVATLTLKEFPNREFTGKLTRTAEAIDVASRTLLAEVDVDNRKGELLPGAYADVHLKLPTSVPTLKVPSTALIFRGDGLQVATLNAGNRVALVPIVVGRDFGDYVEVTSGLAGSERIVANPPDSVTNGQVVRVAAAEDQ